MKRKLIVLLAMSILAMPVAALSAGGHGDHGEMEHKGHDSMDEKKGHGDHGDHGSMKKMGDMIMLGDEIVKDVRGMAHLKDVGKAMADMGMDETHHIMIMFSEEGSGKALEKGSVAVKITSPDEQISSPIKLMGMQGHFGADITMKQKGMYHFKIGTKLADGTKRQYHFHYMVK